MQAIEFHAPTDWLSWIIIVFIAGVCLLLSAFMSGSEIAFFGLTPLQIDDIRDEDTPRSHKLCQLVDNSERLLATILITNNLVNITMVILLTFAINLTIEINNPVLSFILQTVVLTFLLLLFGEVLPKLTARTRMKSWAEAAAPGVFFLYCLFGPLSKLLVRSTSLVSRLVARRAVSISTDDLSQAMEIADVAEPKDKEMLEGILTFGEKQVCDIMVSRLDVTAIEYHSDWQSVIDTILESGYSRIPVYDNELDAIKGILYSKDLLPHLDNNTPGFRWQSLIRKAYFVPESRMIDDLMEDFRSRKIHIAVVVDEYGCTQGIVTLEDILEEIVGEIDDEYDTENHLWRAIAPGIYRFQAKIPLIDFFRATGMEEEEFPHSDEVETLAGLLLAVKGDFPREHEMIKVGGCEFTVLKMERHRIITVQVNLADAPADKNAEKTANKKVKKNG